MNPQIELRLREASVRIIKRVPGARSLDDVQRLTGRDWGDALSEEAQVPRTVVKAITGK
jgi:hypothetical protein